MVKRLIQGMCVSVLAGVLLAVAETVPFIETFDDRDTGVLHDQHGWQAQKQDDARVQTALGHRHISTTEIYTRVEDETLRRALEKL